VKDRFQILQNALLFGDVPEVEVDQLVRLVRSVDLPMGETFTVRGQPLPGMVLVEAGCLEVLLDSSPICSLSPGSLFAEDALVSDSPAPASLRAALPSKVGLLERKAVLREVARLPGLRAALELAYRRRVLAARLYQVDLFQVLSPQARFKLLDRFEVVDIPGGSVLAREGEQGDAFYVIREGEAVLHLPPVEADPLGGDLLGEPDPGAPKAPTTATLRVGDYLGDTMLVDDQKPHGATVTTDYDLRVMKLDRAHFLAALKGMPGQLEEVQAAYKRRSESIL
jgi:CRP-like cAMP-binding protein